MQSKTHWEKIYTTKSSTEVSWYQPQATLSLDLIQRIGVGPDAAIIDVGGGASTLTDNLVATCLCWISPVKRWPRPADGSGLSEH